ncbi:hypothetical protein Sbal117_2868 [Shewanella baltica OS117]|nr:hypothetical protein Sbal117_2868 [Shewanella baltica OS117]
MDVNPSSSNPLLNIFSASTLFEIYYSFQYVHAFANVVAHVFNAERLAMLFYRQLKLASNLDNKIDVDSCDVHKAS